MTEFTPKRFRQYVDTIHDSLKNGDMGPTVGFQPLVSIQIKWTLSKEDEEEEVVWWDAVVVGKTSLHHVLPREEDDEDEEELEKSPVVSRSGEQDEEGKDEEELKDKLGEFAVGKIGFRGQGEAGQDGEELEKLPVPQIRSMEQGEESKSEEDFEKSLVSEVRPREERDAANDEDELEKLPVYQIRYDARPPDFENPEMGRVCVLDDHCVLDCATNATLAWRLKGSGWEEEEDVDEEEAEMVLPVGLQIISDVLDKVAAGESASLTDADGFLLHKPENKSRLPALSDKECEIRAAEVVEELFSNITRKHESVLRNMPAGNAQIIVDRVIELRAKLLTKFTHCLKISGFISDEDVQEFAAELDSS